MITLITLGILFMFLGWRTISYYYAEGDGSAFWPWTVGTAELVIGLASLLTGVTR